ncbi:MAG: hypothetical protein KDI83_03705 [Gammaproteobacteria bacterium]|nr:hypothetical protein [Gammaproteobacteria bacterium]
MTTAKRFNLWSKERPGGERELRASSKFLLTLLPFILGGLLFQTLVAFGKTESGALVIEYLAYAIILLVIVFSLLTLLISLIDYLRSLE